MYSKEQNIFFSFSDKNKPAIISSNQLINYKDLFHQSKSLADNFTKNGIRKSEYIPILIENRIEFIKTVLALWQISAIPVPINTKLLPEEIKALLEDFKFNVLISDINLLINLTENIKLLAPTISSTNYPTENEFKYPEMNQEAIVIFTSGSSDRPKGVVHTFNSLKNHIENGNEILKHKKEDRWLASLPFYHIGGFQIITRSLFYGCTIIIPESLKTNDLANAINKFDPTHISLVSFQLDKFIENKISPNKSLRISLIGGGFIDDKLMLMANQINWKPYRVYGSSETGSFITAISSDEITRKAYSVGKPLNNITVKISSESEILIRSNSLFSNYLFDDNGTKSKLVDGYYYSGDLGYLDDENFLYIEAKREDLIITGGENVNPVEVEKVISTLSFIDDVCVFAQQDKIWGQIIVAAIVVNNSEVSEKTIKDKLKQKLTGYKIPKKFFFTDELPKTSIGKLDRNKIKKMF